ncbi:hypothetical protein [Chryseosolibacter indicus]|uniref:DUF2798 domain-containing protein n=1 Tax=Chryseosolibacter indicus TaxID=2782351 RepID=A0ABS5VRK9_9BACT|nr:hypothetical protein [Chryseosolibacter indicus]MBT1704058.1 hypothetical protein [Chryseosolibacter indicus]
MRIILNLITLALQGIITLIALVAIYMIFVLLDYQGGIDAFVGTILFQPIIGGLISTVTIGICLLIGLPIRINYRINTWWTKRVWLSIFNVFIGLSLLILSLLPSLREIITTSTEDDGFIQREIPNTALAITGWFLTGFSLLHLFPPYKFRIWTENMIKKVYNGES